VLLPTGTVGAEATPGHTSSGSATGVALLLMLRVIAAAGLVLAWHQPANPIGWLLVAAPICLLMTPAMRAGVMP
jgi:hypothetical protein